VSERRQVFAFSGMLVARDDTRTNADLTSHALSLSGRGPEQRLCYLPTAVGDSPGAVDAKAAAFAQQHPRVGFSVLSLFPRPSVSEVRTHLLAQDVILVEGGSVVNLMAVWRAHGLPAILRECWEAGVVLAGASAGSLCWHTGGPTDSFADSLDAFTDGLGLLPFSKGVHDDFAGQPRRETYRRLVADGSLHPGYASEDGVGLHYVGTSLHEAVTLRPRSAAWWVEPDQRGGWRERAVDARPI